MIENCVSEFSLLYTIEMQLCLAALFVSLNVCPIYICIIFTDWIISRRICWPLLQLWICKFPTNCKQSYLSHFLSSYTVQCIQMTWCTNSLLRFRINVWILTKKKLERNWPVLKSSLVIKSTLLVTRSGWLNRGMLKSLSNLWPMF